METNRANPGVFVLVPSYNHGRFIEQCLRSIMGQTVSPKKLLVIDDGSGDSSVQVIERVLRDCAFEAEMVVRPNRGLCATLNEGLAASTGDYFAYLGSDDLWAPRFIERRVAMLESRADAVLGYGHAHLIDDQDAVTDSSLFHTDDWAVFPDGDPWPMLSFGTSPVSSTVMYRRAALDGVAWNESARLEDYEMYLNLSAKGDFAFDRRTLSAWRRHGANTSADSDMMLGEILSAQERAAKAGVITGSQLSEARMRTRFRFAREALQRGDRSRAGELSKGSYGGARSSKELLAFGLRMLIPMGIVNLHRRRKSAGERRNIHDAF